MVMEVIPTFPTELFIFQNNSFDNNYFIDYIKSISNPPIKTQNVISILVDFHKIEEFQNLFNWFSECINAIKIHMAYDCESINIVNSWCNRYTANSGMSLNYHRHSLSFYSGVYYLTNGSPTIFEDPVIHRTQAQLEVLRFNYHPSHAVEAVPGKLCIFPSWMYHRTLPNWSDCDKFILSFNTLPSGKINFNIATDARAEIHVS